MSGLIFLAALGVFITLLVFLSRLATQSLAISTEAKTALRWLIVLGAFPLMVADEMVGMYQFNALCKANGIESADVSKAQGKRVTVESGERTPLTGTVLPIRTSAELIRDANNGEVLIQYKDYYVKGGWLMRYTPISLGDPTPMLFNGNGCGWELKDRVFSKNQISQIN